MTMLAARRSVLRYPKEGNVRDTLALGLVVFVSSAAAATAQTKFTMSGKCAKPDVQQAVPAGDAPNH